MRIKITLMKKIISALLLSLSTLLLPSGLSAQCTTGGFDGITHVPTFSVNQQLLTSNFVTGAYTKVQTLAQRHYTFMASYDTQSGGYQGYITITNDAGTVVYAHGTGIIQWSSGNLSGNVRFYLHSNQNCTGGSSTLRRLMLMSSTSLCALPGGFSTANITSNSVTINWTAPSSAPSAGYQYIITTDTYTPTNSVAAVPTGYSLTTSATQNLTAQTTYRWWVRSSCGESVSAWVLGGIFTTPAIVCNMPSGLTVSDITSTSATLAWQPANPQPSFYDYSLAFNSGGPYNAISVYGTSQFLDNLTPNTTYHYWIRSNCGGGSVSSLWVYGGSFTTNGALSCNSSIYQANPDSNFTPACTGNFETVTSMARASQFSRINILQNREYTFSSTTNTDYITITNETGNLVYASGQTPVVWLSNANSGYVRFFLHSNPSCGQQASYRTKSVKCVPLGPSCLAPISPFVSGVTSNGATLAWTASTQPPGNGYHYYYSSNSTVPTDATIPTGNTNATNIITPVLQTNVTYYFWVRANCGSSQSNWVSGGSFTTATPTGCTNALHELYPLDTFTPACTGNQETIANNAWASEYSNITILPGKQYTFKSSVPSDYVTITNDSGTTIYSGGTTPLIWNSNSVSGILRYYIHTNALCGNNETDRFKWITCGMQVLSGEDAVWKHKIRLHPNPASGYLSIETPEITPDSILIWDQIGRKVSETKPVTTNTVADVSHLSKGVYFVQIKLLNDSVIKRIVVE